MSAPKSYIPGLDGLRAAAILLVIVHNTSINESNAGLAGKLWTGITDMGWIGVQLFFVLSGFLITGLLLDGRDKPHALKTFYIRRSLRIFPLYYVFLIGRFLILPLAMPALAVGFSSQIWYWLYLSNWHDLAHGPIDGLGHFWSLAVEEQFYLTWPWLARKLSRRVFTYACIAISIGALVARCAFYATGTDHAWMYSATISRLDGLALGALVAIAARAELGTRYVIWRRRIGAVALFGLLIVAAKAHGLSRFNPTIQTAGYSLLALVFAAIVAEVADPQPARLWNVFAWSPLRSIGKYSYAMYVFHVPLNVALLYYLRGSLHEHAGAHPIALDIAWTLAIAVGSFVLALISYALIEKPALALRNRWS